MTGFSVVYGVSNNDRVPVDNSKASFLGYRPTDNAEQFAEAILAETEPMDSQDPGNMCHGGPFAAFEPNRVFLTSRVMRAGLSSFSKLFSDKYAAENIRMNNVLPGFIDSLPDKEEFRSMIPMG